MKSAIAVALGVAVGLAAGAAWAADEQVNVSRIVTGLQTDVNFTTELAKPTVVGGTVSYMAMGVARADPAAKLSYDPHPWGSVAAATPPKPAVTRKAALKNYTENGASFTYDKAFTSFADVDMGQADPKPVRSDMFKSGGAEAAVSYHIRVDHTSAQALDYFLILALPKITRDYQPGYDLCCSGDSNGGTYSYHKPKSAGSRALFDLYVDDLPVWSSEQIYVYPPQQFGTPWDKLEFGWGKAAGPGTATFFLGRLSANQSITVTLVARTEAAAVGDCGTEHTGWPGEQKYQKHCLNLAQTISISGGPAAGPPGVTLVSKVPNP